MTRLQETNNLGWPPPFLMWILPTRSQFLDPCELWGECVWPPQVLICVTLIFQILTPLDTQLDRNQWHPDPIIISLFLGMDSSTSLKDPQVMHKTGASRLSSVGFGVSAALIVGRAQWLDGAGTVQLLPLLTQTGDLSRLCPETRRGRQITHPMGWVYTEEHRCCFGSRNYHDTMLQKHDWPQKRLHN